MQSVIELSQLVVSESQHFEQSMGRQAVHRDIYVDNTRYKSVVTYLRQKGLSVSMPPIFLGYRLFNVGNTENHLRIVTE